MLPRTRRLAARTATVTALLGAILTIAAAPAHAGARPPDLTAPQMRLEIVEIRAVGFHVCAFGSAPASGTWRLQITGGRSDGTVINLTDSHTGATWSTSNCLDVLEYGTLSGEWQGAFTYTGGGRTSAVFGGGTWDLVSGEHSWDTA